MTHSNHFIVVMKSCPIKGENIVNQYLQYLTDQKQHGISVSTDSLCSGLWKNAGSRISETLLRMFCDFHGTAVFSVQSGLPAPCYWCLIQQRPLHRWVVFYSGVFFFCFVRML